MILLMTLKRVDTTALTFAFFSVTSAPVISFSDKLSRQIIAFSLTVSGETSGLLTAAALFPAVLIISVLPLVAAAYAGWAVAGPSPPSRFLILFTRPMGKPKSLKS